jgi:hypothetical protein
MSMEQMEARLAAIEGRLAGMDEKLTRLVAGPDPKSRWWEALSSLPPLPPPTAYDEAVAKYIRQTGDCPPKDWKPGDPIPEPDWWN